jgi:hypothetical protein
MTYKVCADCGSRVYDGFCVNCDEETFIAGQYLSDGESVPQGIAETAEEQKQRKEERERND